MREFVILAKVFYLLVHSVSTVPVSVNGDLQLIIFLLFSVSEGFR